MKMRMVCSGVCVLMLISMGAYASKTPQVGVSSARGYTNGDYFINVDSDAVDGGGSCTKTYKVNNSDAGSKNVIATALGAHLSGKKVVIEFTSCNGYGTLIKSIYAY